ncbi:MAG: chromate resistance protein [Cognatishimia sp.]|uniref:chromate resistance protein ChrB domain-containing protein n=1 Tax=Cognatishimia sp. TaxID=2211648 RepID=UPI003B8E13E5
MSGFNEISPKNLMRLIGTTDCPDIVDVRISEDVAELPFRVPTSLSHPHTELSSLAARLTKDSVVVICHKGKKLSAGTAAYLRTLGLRAQVLEGGAVAWDTAGLPAVPLEVFSTISSRWVTRHRPKIDRVACPWLIRRFVDPKAQFFFVPPADVLDVAEKFNATDFDMPDHKWGHVGETCTFDTMIERFGLRHPALERLALVVRAADTDRHDLAPQAAGLLAVSAGLSRMIKDDVAQMEAGFLIYDALYRWARDAHDEGHSENNNPQGAKDQ